MYEWRAMSGMVGVCAKRAHAHAMTTLYVRRSRRLRSPVSRCNVKRLRTARQKKIING